MMENVDKIVSYIRELYNKPDEFIPLHEPKFAGNEKRYLIDCIDSTFVSSKGEFVNKFEQAIADYTGVEFSVACVNGTNALALSLSLVGVERDDEVITQPLTFIATANAISYLYAKPVFIDVDRETMGLSPGKLKEWLGLSTFQRKNSQTQELECINKSTGKRISACVPMHTFGHPCRIDEIIEICNYYNIKVVEDAAESLGSFYKDKHTGGYGDIGILSFNGNKTITTGGGGMMLFRDKKLAQQAKHLTTQAKVSHKWEFNHDHIGYNYRMPNINAALGLAQIENLPIFLESKRNIALAYKQLFATFEWDFVEEPKDSKSNYWLNAIILKDRMQRDQFLEYTNQRGIMTRPIWTLMTKLPMFENCEYHDISNAEWLEDRVVNIPSSAKI